jgi:hypothetical protein
MKRTALIVFGIGLLAAFLGAQQMRTNPARPLHPHPDRIIKLSEVMRIPGEGQGYVLQGIRTLDLDDQGRIYVCDSWTSGQRSHLLNFSPDGRFLKDLNRQGEGPGEIQSMFDFAVGGPEVFLFDSMKRKLVVVDGQNGSRKEFKKPDWGFNEFYGVWDHWLVFQRHLYPTERKKTGLYDVPHKVVFLAKDGSAEKEVGILTNREFYISMAQGGGGMNWDPFTAVLAGNRLYVNSTQEYGIQILDLVSGKIVGSFKREFERVAHEPRKWEGEFISKYGAPKRKYERDVTDLLFGDGLLWVETAKPAAEKKLLYDLFDGDGRYVDRISLDFKGRLLKIDRGFLYAEILDAEDLPSLVKYRIDEPLGVR